MASPKQEALRWIAALPDDATVEDILYEVYFNSKVARGMAQLERGETADHETVMRELDEILFRAKVERGLEQGRRGEVVTQEAARQRMAKWLDQS